VLEAYINGYVVAEVSLFVLKVPFNTNLPTTYCCWRC